MPKWKDQKKHYNLEEPDSSELRLSNFRLIIHRHIHYPKDMWLFSCHGQISCKELVSKKLDEAKKEAAKLLFDILERNLVELKYVGITPPALSKR